MEPKADKPQVPTAEEVKKADEDEKPEAEQPPPAPTTTEEVNKHFETPTLDVSIEEVIVLNKESASEMEAQAPGIQEQVVDVVKGELETDKAETPKQESEKEQVDTLGIAVEAEKDKKEHVEELQANEPDKDAALEVSEAEQKEQNSESAPIIMDKPDEQPEVTETIETAENRTGIAQAVIPKEEGTRAALKEEVEKVEENDCTKGVKTDEKNVITEKLALPEEKEVEASEIAEKAPHVEISSRGIELIAENGSKKDVTNVTTRANEVTEAEKKVDESTATATEQSVEEPPMLETETKQETSKNATKDGEDRKTLEEAFKEEVPAKTKQSNNLIFKMKQSIVKAKKAIMGKSQRSKFEAKNEVIATK